MLLDCRVVIGLLVEWLRGEMRLEFVVKVVGDVS